MSANALPPQENYATLESSYDICDAKQCTWTELNDFENQWVQDNSEIPATHFTEEELKALLDQAKNRPGEYAEMEEFVAGKNR
jgi:hypothetical protein